MLDFDAGVVPKATSCSTKTNAFAVLGDDLDEVEGLK